MMDMLRWILLLLGIVAIAALYAFFRWQEVRSARGAQLQSGYQRSIGVYWRRLRNWITGGLARAGDRDRPGPLDQTGREIGGPQSPFSGPDFDPPGPFEPFDGVVSPVRVAGTDREREPDVGLVPAPPQPADRTVGRRPVLGPEPVERDPVPAVHPPGVRVRPRDPEPADRGQRPAAGSRSGRVAQTDAGVSAADAFRATGTGRRSSAGRAREEAERPVRPARPVQREEGQRRAEPAAPGTVTGQRPQVEPKLPDRDPDADAARTPSAEGAAEPTRLPERVVVLHVVAGQGYVFPASVVVAEVESLGLMLDEDYLFQAFPGQNRQRTPWFGLASMVAPGVFPPGAVDRIETPGVALFMRLPGPEEGVVIFEAMLDTAQKLVARLDGLLLDERRRRLTASTINRLREELSAYGRQVDDSNR